MRAASFATSIANADVNSAMPLMTGTRPRATALPASITVTFSLLVSEQFSHTVSHTLSHDTASLRREIRHSNRVSLDLHCVDHRACCLCILQKRAAWLAIRQHSLTRT